MVDPEKVTAALLALGAMARGLQRVREQWSQGRYRTALAQYREACEELEEVEDELRRGALGAGLTPGEIAAALGDDLD